MMERNLYGTKWYIGNAGIVLVVLKALNLFVK